MIVSVFPFDCNGNVLVPIPSVVDGDGCSSAHLTNYTVYINGDTFFDVGEYISQADGTFIPSPTTFIIPLVGQHTIEICAEDACGNQSCEDIILLVRDETSPIAACQILQEVSLSAGDILNGTEGI